MGKKFRKRSILEVKFPNFGSVPKIATHCHAFFENSYCGGSIYLM